MGASIVDGIERSMPLLTSSVPNRELVLLSALTTVRAGIIDPHGLIHVCSIEGTLLFVIEVVLAKPYRDRSLPNTSYIFEIRNGLVADKYCWLLDFGWAKMF